MAVLWGCPSSSASELCAGLYQHTLPSLLQWLCLLLWRRGSAFAAWALLQHIMAFGWACLIDVFFSLHLDLKFYVTLVKYYNMF
jgi:hypothetical protein